NPAHKWWTPLQAGGGLVDFCTQTDDLRGDTEAFRKAGVSIDDPAPLSRVRPDGYQLRWVLSIPRGAHRGVAPFLIQDETPREPARAPPLRRAARPRRHRAGRPAAARRAPGAPEGGRGAAGGGQAGGEGGRARAGRAPGGVGGWAGGPHPTGRGRGLTSSPFS